MPPRPYLRILILLLLLQFSFFLRTTLRLFLCFLFAFIFTSLITHICFSLIENECYCRLFGTVTVRSATAGNELVNATVV